MLCLKYPFICIGRVSRGTVRAHTILYCTLQRYTLQLHMQNNKFMGFVNNLIPSSAKLRERITYFYSVYHTLYTLLHILVCTALCKATCTLAENRPKLAKIG